MLTSIQSAVAALFADVVGLVVAFVPSFGPDKQILIAAGTQAIVVGFLVGNAILGHAAATVKAAQIKAGPVVPAPTPPAPPVVK